MRRRHATEYLAECFWPGVTEPDLRALDDRVNARAAELSRAGTRVRYLGSLLMREDEVVLCWFEGPEELVRRVAKGASIPFDRIVEAALVVVAARTSLINRLEETDMDWHRLSGRSLAGIGTLLIAGALAGCSASSGGTPTPSVAVRTPVPTATAAATATPSAAPASVDVSGAWKGQYSGPFNGTFTLTWTQASGGALSGQIVLSSPPDTLNINGQVSGGSISFGAVGVVTYSGTVSGSTMSGSYTDLANGQNGSWNATKS